jgi:hypothetical protein
MARPSVIVKETGLWLALDISSFKLTDDQLIRFFAEELATKGT